MELIPCPIDGLKIIRLDKHSDERGVFIERYQREKFYELGIKAEFVQDNHSQSKAGVLRGLHWQQNPAQGKLIGVTHGRIWDVAVDLRPESSTFGQHHAVELSAENATLLWIPAGFAHGFCVLGNEPADLIYKVSGIYNKNGEGGINFDDTELAINWPTKNPIVSERDKNLQSFKEYKKNPVIW